MTGGRCGRDGAALWSRRWGVVVATDVGRIVRCEPNRRVSLCVRNGYYIVVAVVIAVQVVHVAAFARRPVGVSRQLIDTYDSMRA